MIDGLKAKYRTAIIDALASNDRVERAVLFGSRATETYTSASDVDIALFGDRLTLIDQARLNGIIDELTIPQRVDLLLHATIDNDVLRKHIEKQGVEWYRRQGSQETELKDLLPKHRSVLEAILREHLPNTDVWAYGNRVSSPESDGCDLNLVLRARDLQKIPDARMDNFKRAVRASSVPFPVNVQDWACISEQFRRKLQRERMVLIKKLDGEVSTAWPMVPLGQVAELTLSSVDKKTKPHEHPVLLCNYMDVYSNQFIRSDLDFMAATATEHEIRRCALRPGDVIITKDSEKYDDIGVPALVRDDIDNIVCGYHLAILRQLPEAIRGSYLFYALQIGSVRYQFHSYANGVTRFGLRKDDILRVNVPLPPLPKQRAIARILGALDEKIELNRRMNQTLEALAYATFLDWFVDFRPVHAMMAGHDTGLPGHIAELFPKKLVDSEIGKIPVGWESSTIGEEVKVVGGTTPSTKNPAFWNDGEHAWATPKDLSTLTSPVLLDTHKKITDAGVTAISSGLLPTGAVLLSSRAPIGYLAISEISTAINQGFIAMICEKRLPRLYVLFWCYKNLNYIKNISGGSTFSEISKSLFRTVSITVPSKKVLVAYESIVQPIYDRIVVNMKEILLLANTRDTLLPKLVSGQVCVHDVEGVVETKIADYSNCNSVQQFSCRSPSDPLKSF